jgi:hypothetical protein
MDCSSRKEACKLLNHPSNPAFWTFPQPIDTYCAVPQAFKSTSLRNKTVSNRFCWRWALSRLNIPHSLLVFPRENHSLNKNRGDSGSAIADSLVFLLKVLDEHDVAGCVASLCVKHPAVIRRH